MPPSVSPVKLTSNCTRASRRTQTRSLEPAPTHTTRAWSGFLRCCLNAPRPATSLFGGLASTCTELEHIPDDAIERIRSHNHVTGAGACRLSLDFGSNRLTAVPAEICGGTCIYCMDFQTNQILELPAAICDLGASLCILDLRNNKLASLPANLASLESLTFLNVRNNRLRELPDLPRCVGAADVQVAAPCVARVVACRSEVAVAWPLVMPVLAVEQWPTP